MPPPNWNRGYNSWRSDQPRVDPLAAWNGPDLTAPPPNHWSHKPSRDYSSLTSHPPPGYRGGEYVHYSPHHPPPRIEPRRESRSSRDRYRERSYGGYSKSYRGRKRSRSRTLSSLSSESDHRSSRRRPPKASRHNVAHSPISVSSRSRSLSSISRSPSPAAYSSRSKRRKHYLSRSPSRSPRRMSSRRMKSRVSRDRSPGTPPRRIVKNDYARHSPSPEGHRTHEGSRRRRSKDHQLPDRTIHVTSYRSPSPRSPVPKRKIFQARSPTRRSPSPPKQWRHSGRHEEGEGREGRSATSSSNQHKWDSYKGSAGQSSQSGVSGIQYTVPPPSSTPQYTMPVPPTATWPGGYQQPAPLMGASYAGGSAMYNQQYFYPSGNPQMGVQQSYQTQQPYQSAVKTLTKGGFSGKNQSQHRNTQNIQVLTSQAPPHHSQMKPPSNVGKSTSSQAQSLSSAPSSRNQASNVKKSWSMGSNALMFQRILSSDGKGKP